MLAASVSSKGLRVCLLIDLYVAKGKVSKSFPVLVTPGFPRAVLGVFSSSSGPERAPFLSLPLSSWSSSLPSF